MTMRMMNGMTELPPSPPVLHLIPWQLLLEAFFSWVPGPQGVSSLPTLPMLLSLTGP